MSRAASRKKRSASPLKRLRVFLAGGFFLSINIVFLDIHGAVPQWIYDTGVYFQFLPSLLYATRAFGIAATGCILVLGLTLVFGRIYCSSVCPLGIFMDMIAFLKKKATRPIHHRYAPPRNMIRYGLLMCTMLCFASGSMLMINLLDPFSNFGRMAVALVKPLVILGNNGAAYALEMAGNYDIPPHPLKGLHLGMIGFTLGFAALVCSLALTRGRLYCNTICPVGAFLGLCAKAAPVKILIKENDCIGCGKCERICKSDCIDLKDRIIDHSRCVACFNCLDTCPTGAAVYGYSLPLAAPIPPSEGHPTHTRRGFLAAVGTALALLPRASEGIETVKVTIPNKIQVPLFPHPILPPGALSLDHFTGTCTGCHACVARCPAHVLQPGITQYGLAGLFMPFLDPGSGFCNLNCNLCGQACPTHAITSFSLEEKKTIQTGVVKFIRDNCIVVLQKTDCGACSEHCPTKAVTMVTEGKVKVPKVNEKICLGCGACEHVCPAKPNKSIYVHPHTVHKKAEAPPSRRLEIEVPAQGGDGFNF